jgi:hypothetical protein
MVGSVPWRASILPSTDYTETATTGFPPIDQAIPHIISLVESEQLVWNSTRVGYMPRPRLVCCSGKNVWGPTRLMMSGMAGSIGGNPVVAVSV